MGLKSNCHASTSIFCWAKQLNIRTQLSLTLRWLWCWRAFSPRRPTPRKIQRPISRARDCKDNQKCETHMKHLRNSANRMEWFILSVNWRTKMLLTILVTWPASKFSIWTLSMVQKHNSFIKYCNQSSCLLACLLGWLVGCLLACLLACLPCSKVCELPPRAVSTIRTSWGWLYNWFKSTAAWLRFKRSQLTLHWFSLPSWLYRR